MAINSLSPITEPFGKMNRNMYRNATISTCNSFKLDRIKEDLKSEMSLKNRIEYPELLKKASEEQQKVYHILDNNLDIDIIFVRDGVIIQTKLGEKIIGRIPLIYKIEDGEVTFNNYN